MHLILDNLLRESVKRACERASLGRTGDFLDRTGLLIEILCAFEADGSAMRFLNSKGRFALKATPKLRQYLKDLELDARDELADI